ncbi:MAG: CBS domain-containing protein [Candidatus Saccharimonadales bacterium]
MELSLWLVILDAVLWLGVFFVFALQIKRSSLSSFELERLAHVGDNLSKDEAVREQRLPRLLTLNKLFQITLLIIAVGVSVTTYGWWLGLAFSIALGLMLGVATRIVILRSVASNLYKPRESQLLELVSNWHWLDALRFENTKQTDSGATSREELQNIVERSAGVLTKDQLARLQASLTLDNHVVEDIMTPVSVVDTADAKDALGPLVIDDLHKTGHSRFPVIDNDIHHIVGILYLHDVISLKSDKKTVREAMDSRVHYIHESHSLERALHGFLKTHRHLFVVVNDYRETVGVLTLEDVLETLLGKKIVDEFDRYEDLRAVAESNPMKNNIPKRKIDI